MIEVTRLNGSIYFINPDMILLMEATPDTVITLTNNEKVMVRETTDTIIDRFITLKRHIACELPEVKIH